MSVDIEPTADLASAGLVAGELDGDAGKRAEAHPQAHAPCANCGSELHGEYCHRCGQFSHVHRSILHIIEEAVHGLLHFDTKIFRTLPLLFARPGLLTRRYIDGQRARYVAPFALFLFNIFFMVFCSSLALNDASDTTQRAQGRASLLEQVEAQRTRVAQATQAVAANPSQAAEEALSDAQIELRALSFALAAADATVAPPQSTVSAFIDDVQRDTALDQRFGALSHAIDHAQENPDLALYKLKGAASKLSFLLVPIALPFLWLMFFWRKDVLLYDHAIFALYSISFMSLWIVLIELVSSVHALAGLVPFLLLVPFLHVFMQLKETYQLGIAAAAWRTAALGFATTLAGVFYLLLVLLVTFH